MRVRYHARDKEGKTDDFLLTSKRDKAATLPIFEQTLPEHAIADKVMLDKSGVNIAPMDQIIEDKEISSSSGRTNTSITSSGKTLVPSNALPDRCSA